MGTTLSVTTGFGFAIPVEVENAYNETSEDGLGEDIWDITREEPLVESDTAYFYDYTPDDDESMVIFVKSTMKTTYGVGVFRPRGVENIKMPHAEEFNALHRVAEKLGYKNPEFEFLTVVSCG